VSTLVAKWLVRDKRRFLSAVMDGLAGNAHISFEGSLGAVELSDVPGASEAETPTLRRNTTWPKQDFVVVPLEPSTTQTILSKLGGSVPKSIIHVQIEKDGVLEFGAYDNFHPECLYMGRAVTEKLLESYNLRRAVGPESRSHPAQKCEISIAVFDSCRPGPKVPYGMLVSSMVVFH